MTPQELAGVIGALVNATSEADLRLAIHRGQERGVTLLKRKSPVDQGQYKNSWQAVEGREIVNSSPIAGIIERGARPHAVSEEGRAALFEWVRRVIRPSVASKPTKRAGAVTRTKQSVKRWIKGVKKWLGIGSGPGAAPRNRARRVDAAYADAHVIAQIVEAICWKIKHHGQAPKWVALRVLPQLGQFAGREVAKLVGEKIKEGMKGPT